MLILNDSEAIMRQLRDPRLERAIGVIYRPETERQSHFRMGRELEANRNISVRLVADRSTAQSVSTTFGGACEVKAVQEWRLPKAASRS
jgi:hypothetical protein